MYSKTVQKLINLFSKFPGVGQKTASRFVFYLTGKQKQDLEELSKTISILKDSLKVCEFCFKLFEGEGQLCKICSDKTRNRNILCVIEKETDLVSIEENKFYKGLYFILGGTVSKLKKQDIEKLRIADLIKRIKEPEKFGIEKAKFSEIILATNPTLDGEATALFLERKLKDLRIKTTRLAKGLPAGGELEYAHKETLKSSFEKRT